MVRLGLARVSYAVGGIGPRSRAGVGASITLNSVPQQSNRAHDADFDSEASPQASSSQDREHHVVIGIVGFAPDVKLLHGWRFRTWR